MRTNVRIAATTVALLLAVMAGCGKQNTGLKSSGVQQCKGTNTASTCDANGVCTVVVTVASDDTITVDPFTLLVGDGPRTIVWKLNTAGYEFTKSDGPKKIKNDKDGKDDKVPANFKDGTPVAKDDGSEAVEKSKLFKLAYKNADSGQKWKYDIQVRSESGEGGTKGKGKGPGEQQILSCDPFINSQGG